MEERYSTTTTSAAPTPSKTVFFYPDGSSHGEGLRVSLQPHRFRNMEALMEYLTGKMPDLPYGARTIFSPRGRTPIQSLESLNNQGHYIVSDRRSRARGIQLDRLTQLPSWRTGRPPSGQRMLSYSLQPQVCAVSLGSFTTSAFGEGSSSGTAAAPSAAQRSRSVSNAPSRNSEENRSSRDRSAGGRSRGRSNQRATKVIYVHENGDAFHRHRFTLQRRRRGEGLSLLLNELSNKLRSPVHRLFTLEGAEVFTIEDIFKGPEEYVAVGLQRFRPLANPHIDLSNKRHRPLSPSAETTMQNGSSNPQRGRSRQPVRAKHGLMASVTPTRRALPLTSARSEATTSGSGSIRSSRSMGSLGDKQAKRRVPEALRVYLTWLRTSNANANHVMMITFTPSGAANPSKVNLGNIGEIIKIRLSHDNSGDSPDLLVAMVRMRPVSGTALQLSTPSPRSRNPSSENKTATASSISINRGDAVLADVLTFPCGRWLSRRHGDGDTTCELPSPLSAALALSKRQRRLDDTRSQMLRGRLRNLTASQQTMANGVGRSQGDLASRLLLASAATLPIILYRVVIKTSELWGAGTHSSVNVIIFGEFGDTGPRLLWKPEDDLREPFQRGQTDVFYVEAVYLGELKFIRVWLEGEQGFGSSWCLDWIQVIETAPTLDNRSNPVAAPVSELIHFACDRWLNVAKQGHMAEVELFPIQLSEAEFTTGHPGLSPSKAAQCFVCSSQPSLMMCINPKGRLVLTEYKDGDPDLTNGSGFVIRPQLRSWVKLELVNSANFEDRPKLTFDSHGRLGIRPTRPSGAQEHLWMPYVKVDTFVC
nr:unnamed protein product [Spirometra erinaceieuropaei]